MMIAEIEALLAGVAEFSPLFERCKEEAPAIFIGARRRLGVTQAGLGLLIGFHPTYISNVERGHVPPSLPVLVAMHQLLKEHSGRGS